MNPRWLAVSVLQKVGRGKFAAPTLDQALLRHRLPRQQAGLLTDLVYGTLRRLHHLEYSLKPNLKNPSSLPDGIRWLLYAAAYELWFTHRPKHAVVNAWVGVAKRLSEPHAGLVNAVLRRARLDQGAPAAVKLGIPDFLYQEWSSRFDDLSWVEELNEPSPLWLTLYPGGRELLQQQGVSFSDGPLPDSVRLEGVPLREVEAFRKGLAQPQNPSSLLAAVLLGAGEGELVLDLAGGSGLKAAWLAARGARVLSVDSNTRRQQEGRKNLERLGLNVEFLTHDIAKPLGRAAPYVLLDAPCLGTGTLRGHPELRLRLKQQDLSRMAALQRRLLETAAEATEPGGVLLYSVCSLTLAEGEKQIRDFLSRHPEFEPSPLEPPLPLLERGAGVYVKPTEGLDGFYYARLQKLS
ncbi:RsmB/NOP family class I SAM-dependent RNA methyltransferase [Oceanithermus sp.]